MRFITIVLISLFVGAVFAAPTELEKINSQIAQTEQENKQLENRVQTSDRDIESTKKKLVHAADKVSELEALRGQMAKKIEELDAKQQDLQKSLDQNHDNISDAAASMLYIVSNPSFDSENMHQFVLTSAVLSGTADRFDGQIQIATKKIEELQNIIKQRKEEKEKLDRTAKKYEKDKKYLDNLLRQRSAQNIKLRDRQSEIKQKLTELSKRAKNISELSAGVGNSKMSDTAKFSRNKLKSPVRGRLVVKFGEKTALGLESDGWRIRARGNALVVAPADGSVKFAGVFRGFGRVLIISHKNGYNTVMTNFGELNVLVGQNVLAGEPVGRMDEDKSEMYLEVRRGKNTVDPARLFNEP